MNHPNEPQSRSHHVMFTKKLLTNSPPWCLLPCRPRRLQFSPALPPTTGSAQFDGSTPHRDIQRLSNLTPQLVGHGFIETGHLSIGFYQLTRLNRYRDTLLLIIRYFWRHRRSLSTEKRRRLNICAYREAPRRVSRTNCPC